MVRLGHAYFINCVDEASARRAWEFRLLPFFRKACRLDRPMFDRITRSWATAFPAPAAAPAGTPASDGGPEGAGEAQPETDGDSQSPPAEPT